MRLTNDFKKGDIYVDSQFKKFATELTFEFQKEGVNHFSVKDPGDYCTDENGFVFFPKSESLFKKPKTWD